MEIWELAVPAYGHSCSNTKAPHTNGSPAAISLQRCRSAFRLKVRGYSTRIEVYSEEPIETLWAIFQGAAPSEACLSHHKTDGPGPVNCLVSIVIAYRPKAPLRRGS